jgi:hypothetical protein
MSGAWGKSTPHAPTSTTGLRSRHRFVVCKAALTTKTATHSTRTHPLLLLLLLLHLLRPQNMPLFCFFSLLFSKYHHVCYFHLQMHVEKTFVRNTLSPGWSAPAGKGQAAHGRGWANEFVYENALLSPRERRRVAGWKGLEATVKS